MQKLYAYVDETGQDASSTFFLVSVIVAEEERDQLLEVLEKIERASKKGRRKWMETRPAQRLAYMQAVLSTALFKKRLIYAVYPNTTDYLSKTVLTTARAITLHAKEEYKATILIDGLPESLTGKVGAQLRLLHIRTRKVRGIRKEEADALIRLADAVCGFVRAATIKKDEELVALLERGKADGYIQEV